MGEVHADGGALAQNRIRATRIARGQLGMNPQRLIGGMPHAEHPLIAAHRAHTTAHLIGQRLKGQPVIRGGQGAA